MNAPRPALLLPIAVAALGLLSTEALAAGGYRKTKKKVDTPMSKATDAIADERSDTAISLQSSICRRATSRRHAPSSRG